ncbi:MAG: Rrf2 family transcriptional regulator, partial [Anaerolineae bacterium]
LEAVLNSLRTAGYVHAQRGPQGGYALSRPPESVTLRDVFGVLEGEGGYVRCTSDPSACHRRAQCVTQSVWARMYEASMNTLESVTLADLVAEARVEHPLPDYQI